MPDNGLATPGELRAQALAAPCSRWKKVPDPPQTCLPCRLAHPCHAFIMPLYMTSDSTLSLCPADPTSRHSKSPEPLPPPPIPPGFHRRSVTNLVTACPQSCCFLHRNLATLSTLNQLRPLPETCPSTHHLLCMLSLVCHMTVTDYLTPNFCLQGTSCWLSKHLSPLPASLLPSTVGAILSSQTINILMRVRPKPSSQRGRDECLSETGTWGDGRGSLYSWKEAASLHMLRNCRFGISTPTT